MINFLFQSQVGILVSCQLLFFLKSRLAYVFRAALINFRIGEPLFKRRQKYVARRYLLILVVLLELLELPRLDQPVRVLAHVVVDRVVDLLQRVLLVPPLLVVLVDHRLHPAQPLRLPLVDLAGQLFPATPAVLGWGTVGR